jgi:hypothetical protein
MVDGQWDVIPTAKGQLLNAVDLQGALARKEDVLTLSWACDSRLDRGEGLKKA